MSPLIYFTAMDVGCFADGAFGHQYCRERLADAVETLMVRRNGHQIATPALVASLRGEMPDDAWDEDEALSFLQGHTAEGLTWEFIDGDLVLTEDAQ